MKELTNSLGPQSPRTLPTSKMFGSLETDVQNTGPTDGTNCVAMILALAVDLLGPTKRRIIAVELLDRHKTIGA